MKILPLLNWNYKDIWSYIKGFTSIGSPSKTDPNRRLYNSITRTYKYARELKIENLEIIKINDYSFF